MEQTNSHKNGTSLKKLIYPAAVEVDKYYPPTVLLRTPSVFQPKFCMFQILVHYTVPTAAGSRGK
jgi:hypothetical protein